MRNRCLTAFRVSWTGAGAAVAISLLAATGTVSPTRAEGALAIGDTGNIAEDGFAFGYSFGYDTTETAQARALAECRGASEADESVRALCKIVVTFRNQCVAIAYDPDEGKPGFGWALGGDMAAAEQAALDKCRAAAGPAREAYCNVAERACDRK